MSTPDPTYASRVYHPDLCGVMPEGNATVEQWVLRFAGGDLVVDFPLDGLLIDFREYDSGRLIFTHPGQPGWTLYCSDLEILDHPGIRKRTSLRLQIEREARRRNGLPKLAKITVGVFAAFMALALLVVWIGGLLVSHAVSRVPISVEQKLADEALQTIRDEWDVVHDPELTAALEAMAHRILPPGRSPYQFRVVLVDSPEANAFALPGGTIVVLTGLLEMMETPEEVAGVMAHEMAHVTHRHTLRQIVATVGPYLVLRALLQGGNALTEALGTGSQLVFSQNFSQKFETEADDTAWDCLVRANVDPRGLSSSLQKLYNLYGGMEHLEIQALSSHPPTRKRIARLEAKWEKLPRKSGFELFDGLPERPRRY